MIRLGPLEFKRVDTTSLPHWEVWRAKGHRKLLGYAVNLRGCAVIALGFLELEADRKAAACAHMELGALVAQIEADLGAIEAARPPGSPVETTS